VGDVVLDQQLGAREGVVKEARGGDVAQVADEAGAEQADEAEDVGGVVQGDERLEALVDEAVVVERAGGRLAPGGC
jgi:hypothetical protein